MSRSCLHCVETLKRRNVPWSLATVNVDEVISLNEEGIEIQQE